MSFYAEFTKIRPVKFKINNSTELFISHTHKMCYSELHKKNLEYLEQHK